VELGLLHPQGDAAAGLSGKITAFTVIGQPILVRASCEIPQEAGFILGLQFIIGQPFWRNIKP
jgi:hypothetical protein